MVCRRTNIPTLPRGSHYSNVMLIRNSGVRYLFGIAHNKTQRVGNNGSKTRSEKEAIPPVSRFHSPLYDGDLPHAIGSPSLSVPFLIAVAMPMKAIKYDLGMVVDPGWRGLRPTDYQTRSTAAA
jgi:hypothetical protein